MKKPYRVTRISTGIAVVIYSKTGRVAHQGIITVQDLPRLQPLFQHYLNMGNVAALNEEIRNA